MEAGRSRSSGNPWPRGRPGIYLLKPSLRECQLSSASATSTASLSGRRGLPSSEVLLVLVSRSGREGRSDDGDERERWPHRLSREKHVEPATAWPSEDVERSTTVTVTPATEAPCVMPHCSLLEREPRAPRPSLRSARRTPHIVRGRREPVPGCDDEQIGPWLRAFVGRACPICAGRPHSSTSGEIHAQGLRMWHTFAPVCAACRRIQDIRGSGDHRSRLAVSGRHTLAREMIEDFSPRCPRAERLRHQADAYRLSRQPGPGVPPLGAGRPGPEIRRSRPRAAARRSSIRLACRLPPVEILPPILDSWRSTSPADRLGAQLATAEVCRTSASPPA